MKKKCLQVSLILITWVAVATLSVVSLEAQNINPNAYYRLVAKHNGSVLHVDNSTNGGMDNQADVVARKWTGDKNQQWRIEPLGDGTYRLIAAHSSKMLDVNLGADNQANVVQHEWHGGDNQRWRFEPVGDGYYRLIAKHSGRALDVNIDNYANVVQNDWHGGDNQRWKIELVQGTSGGVTESLFNPNAYYRLVAKHNGSVLHVDNSTNGGMDNQADVVARKWTGDKNQQWRIEPLGDGTYRLIAAHSSKMLDVNLGADNQANVVQHEWHGGDNQRWRFEPVGDGYYRLIAKHSGRALDVNIDNYANVVQNDWHGGDNQRWKIELVQGTSGGTSDGIDLTGFWKDDEGGTYEIRQIGNKIWWHMSKLPKVTNVFTGNISGNTVSGEWADLPDGTLSNTGTLQFRIISNVRLEKINSSFQYGGSVWTRK